MSLQPWYYFLSIERDFIRTLDFVEFNADNEATYSNEFAKLLLLIGSEVDVVAKMLCKRADASATPNNINEYRSVITARYSNLYTFAIQIPRFNYSTKPWESWGAPTPESPVWWKSYNKVKHQRDEHFAEANFKNVTDALCGLLSLLLYFYRSESHLQPYPELLNGGFPQSIVTSGTLQLP